MVVREAWADVVDDAEVVEQTAEAKTFLVKKTRRQRRRERQAGRNKVDCRAEGSSTLKEDLPLEAVEEGFAYPSVIVAGKGVSSEVSGDSDVAAPECGDTLPDTSLRDAKSRIVGLGGYDDEDGPDLETVGSLLSQLDEQVHRAVRACNDLSRAEDGMKNGHSDDARQRLMDMAQETIGCGVQMGLGVQLDVAMSCLATECTEPVDESEEQLTLDCEMESDAGAVEYRIDPRDGVAYTWQEFAQWYRSSFSVPAIVAYWDRCAEIEASKVEVFNKCKAVLKKMEADGQQGTADYQSLEDAANLLWCRYGGR